MAGKPCAVHGCWHMAKYHLNGLWYCTFHRRKLGKKSMGDIYA